MGLTWCENKIEEFRAIRQDITKEELLNRVKDLTSKNFNTISGVLEELIVLAKRGAKMPWENQQ